MKLERIVVALFLTALIVRVSSMYYTYLNYKSGENSAAVSRHIHDVIETISDLEFENSQLQYSADKYKRFGTPYFANLTNQNKANLNKSLQILSDSVTASPQEMQQVNAIKALELKMESGLASADSSYNHSPEGKIKMQGSDNSDALVNDILLRLKNLNTQEYQLFDVWRGSVFNSRRKSFYQALYAAIVGSVFVFIILFALNWDIGRRKQAEALIRDNEQKFRRMIEEVGDVIYSSDFNGCFTFINARLESLTGYTTGELIGKNFVSLVHPDWSEKVKEFYHHQFTNKLYETRFEFPIVTKQGQTKWVEQNVVMASRGKMVEGFQCVVRDITRRKEAEENMKAALEKEKQINELKSRFVALASHEFRTPLSTILSSTELIGEYIQHEERDPAVIKAKEIHHLKRIKASIQNMVTILNNFLSLDQLEQGKTLTGATDFDARQLSQATSDDVKEKLKPGQRIVLDHTTAETQVYMDRGIVGNIMLNLLTNAIKYSPENSTIKFTTGVGPEGLTFTVEDRGIGIPESEQGQLFERFFRAKNTLNIEGTGLGLSIVKKYVDLLNGTIAFRSGEKTGTAFTVFIASAKRPTVRQEKPLKLENT